MSSVPLARCPAHRYRSAVVTAAAAAERSLAASAQLADSRRLALSAKLQEKTALDLVATSTFMAPPTGRSMRPNDIQSETPK